MDDCDMAYLGGGHPANRVDSDHCDPITGHYLLAEVPV